MTQPAIPDNDYEPTDQEIIRALDWDDADDADDVAPEATAPESTPQPESQPLPAAAPAPEPTPAPVAQVPPPPDPFAQAKEQELQQLREQEAIQQCNQQAQQYMNGLINQGWEQESARVAATQYAHTLLSNHRLEESKRISNETAKRVKAYELSHQYGTPVEMLTAYSDPASMEQAAKMWQATQGQIADLKKQITNPAPVQSFDSNRMTASNSVTALRARYATDPNFNPTEEQLARILG